MSYQNVLNSLSDFERRYHVKSIDELNPTDLHKRAILASINAISYVAIEKWIPDQIRGLKENDVSSVQLKDSSSTSVSSVTPEHVRALRPHHFSVLGHLGLNPKKLDGPITSVRAETLKAVSECQLLALDEKGLESIPANAIQIPSEKIAETVPQYIAFVELRLRQRAQNSIQENRLEEAYEIDLFVAGLRGRQPGWLKASGDPASNAITF